jgi:hypothetical protein
LALLASFAPKTVGPKTVGLLVLAARPAPKESAPLVCRHPAPVHVAGGRAQGTRPLALPGLTHPRRQASPVRVAPLAAREPTPTRARDRAVQGSRARTVKRRRWRATA